MKMKPKFNTNKNYFYLTLAKIFNRDKLSFLPFMINRAKIGSF